MAASVSLQGYFSDTSGFVMSANSIVAQSPEVDFSIEFLMARITIEVDQNQTSPRTRQTHNRLNTVEIKKILFIYLVYCDTAPKRMGNCCPW